MIEWHTRPAESSTAAGMAYRTDQRKLEEQQMINRYFKRILMMALCAAAALALFTAAAQAEGGITT